MNRTDTLLCVTNCSTENPEAIDCHKGQCSLTNKGPQCYCELSNQYWYTGDRCQNAISKAGVIAGVTVGLLILIIIIGILVFFSHRRQHRSDKFKLIGEPELCWYQDDSEKDPYARSISKPDTDKTRGASVTSNTSVFQPSLGIVNTDAKLFTARPRLMNYESQ
ncbi:mucin-17-like [Hyperolius riggenbachi]|uniref:mucin-17-like n=1 Tax=Hyperolius riggenbachi TaxID=752182 RepID=UPI0035A2D18F